MRNAALAVAIAVLFAGSAAADCNDPTSGPSCAGGICWYQYSPDLSSSCWTRDSGVTSTTMSCYGSPSGYRFASFSQHISRTFTVDSDGGYGTNWSLEFDYDLIDPHDSWWNQLDVRVSVYRPSTNQIFNTYGFYMNGTQGDTYCGNPYFNFTAQNGDVVTIDFLGSTGWSDSYVKVSNVLLFRY